MELLVLRPQSEESGFPLKLVGLLYLADHNLTEPFREIVLDARRQQMRGVAVDCDKFNGHLSLSFSLTPAVRSFYRIDRVNPTDS